MLPLLSEWRLLFLLAADELGDGRLFAMVGVNNTSNC